MKRIIGSLIVTVILLTQLVLPNQNIVEANTASTLAYLEQIASSIAPLSDLQANQTQSESVEQYEITLITGDTVIVSIMEDDEKAIAISPDDNEINQNFWVMDKPTGDGNNTYVIPGDIDLTKFDMELFNIDYLIDKKYYELSYLPVLLVEEAPTEIIEPTNIENQVAVFAKSVNHFPDFSTTSVKLNKDTMKNAFRALKNIGNVKKIWLDKMYQVDLSESVPLIEAPAIWDSGYTGEGIVIAILDTGIDETHPDLDDLDDNPATNDPKVLLEVNFTDDPNADDGHGHGTHCASIAAGTGSTYTGVAPGAWLYNVKVLGEAGYGATSWIINGVEYAALGPDGIADTGDEADIISMSLGSSGTDGTDPLSLAVDWAVAQGVVVITSAGNTGDNYYTVGKPGVAHDIITVGSTDKSDVISDFSSRGPTPDQRIKPDVVAPGSSIIAARANGTSMGTPVDANYTSASGTSMAAPHVAGAAALILEANPTIPLGWDTPKFAKSTLMANAIDLGYDVYTQGAGRISLPPSVNPIVMIDPVTTSFGTNSGDTTYNQTITFTNIDDVPHQLTLTPQLSEIYSAADYSGNVTLDMSVFTLNPGEVLPVSLEIDTTGLTQGTYSGKVTAIVDGGTHNLQSIFGFSKLNELTINKIDMNGDPIEYGYVLAFNESAQYYEGTTNAAGTCTLYVNDGNYQIFSLTNDGISAPVYSFAQATTSGTTTITMDDRDTVAIDFDPNKSGQVMAEKCVILYYTGDAFSLRMKNIWRYPNIATTYMSTTTSWKSNFTYSYYPEEYYDPDILETPEWHKLRYGLDTVTGPVTFIADYSSLVTRNTYYYTTFEDVEACIAQFAISGPTNSDSTYEWKINAPMARTEYFSLSPVGYQTLYYDELRENWHFSEPNYISYSAGTETGKSYGRQPFNSGTYFYIEGGYLTIYGTACKDNYSSNFYNYSSDVDGHVTLEQNSVKIIDSDVDGYFYGQIPSTGNPLTSITIDGESSMALSPNTQTVLNFVANPATGYMPPDFYLFVGDVFSSPYMNLYNEILPGDIPLLIYAYDPDGTVNTVSMEYSLDDGAIWNPLALSPLGSGWYQADLSILDEQYISLQVYVEDTLGNSRLQKNIRGLYVTDNWLISPEDGDSLAAGDIDFTWNEIPGASGYHIQIDTAPTFDSPDLIETDTVDTQYTCSLDMDDYYWHVKAYLSGGETAYCAPWQLNITYPEVDFSMALQGGSRPDAGWEIPVTIKFFTPGADVLADTPLEVFNLTTSKSGSTAICQCNMAPGTYDVSIVSEHTLTNVLRNVTITFPSASLNMGTLIEGDANNDGIVNISDFGILAVSYNKMEGDPGFDARADFDRNGIINISDFGLLAVNFMKMSPVEVTVP